MRREHVEAQADMEEKRQVPWEKAEAFAQQEGLQLGRFQRSRLAVRFLLDTSAMSGKNVQRLFEGVAELLPDEPFVPQQRGLQVTTNLASASTQDSKQPARRCCG